MTKPVRRILVTNDDGINAPGLKAAVQIANALSDDIWVVAPMEEKSGASHSLSLTQPLRLIKKGKQKYAVTGTPTDCVMFATRHMLRDDLPELVLSGVNFGQNIAEDVSYSGTVAAAKEGTLFGIPSMALSQAISLDNRNKIRFEVGVKHGPAIIRKLFKLDWPRDTLMNINFPDIEPDARCKVRITKQGKRDARILCLEERIDPRNNSYYWYDFKRESINAGRGTDIEAILEGDISITPLKMDHTDTGTKKMLSALFG